ncbi:SRPBCC family protein [Rhizobium tubonense]|jgi:uncharacterized protein YndB with AHSA1/START domain|uniref:ATPase n=1 Tax=Rhizobium tubonense TaxID=484088 RepID=A0A2W4D1H6_9HYPH|nr:SRPBCC domain-containing protein [Rhizobium tubonense]PZM17251.1 ATPase [Rhizobium tubonense]
MNKAMLQPNSRDIVVDEFFPHARETIWKTLTSGDMIARFLMKPTGFAPALGNHFTFQTTPAGEWDGIIHCEVVDVVPNERFAYTWKGGHPANRGYGSLLDTLVIWTLSEVEGGTRLRLVHSGFITPTNDTAFMNMSEGWKKVVPRIGPIVDEQS